MSRPISLENKTRWEARIRQQCESGLSIKQWCLQNQVSLGAFQYRKSQLLRNTELTRSCFVELPIEHKTGICIEYQGCRILIDRAFDPDTLRSCLIALRGVQC